MEFISTQRFVRISPRKLRQVVFMVRNLRPVDVVETMPHINKRSSIVVMKGIKTAIANASAKGVNAEELVIKELQVNDGPRLKRFRAGSRGGAKPFMKRTSHFRIVLATKEIGKVKEKVSKKDSENKMTNKSEKINSSKKSSKGKTKQARAAKGGTV